MRADLFPDPAVEEGFKAVAAGAGVDAHALAAELLVRCERMPERTKKQYVAPMLVARDLIAAAGGAGSGPGADAVHKAIVAAACLRLPETLANQGLPESVMSLLPGAVGRVLETLLANNASERYDESSDLYRKDLRFVAGQTVPCGAQDVDMFASASWTTIVKNPSWSKVSRYLAVGGLGTWFRIHTDPRNTGDFNEAGWRSCYKRVADLLLARPGVKGMVGTSWFYDPQLVAISPRLAYLQNDPISGGALMLRNGPGEIHTQRATMTSPSRRKLFEEGKYLPICYTVLWPRQDLIDWVATQGLAKT